MPSLPTSSSRCVVLVPSGRKADPSFEEALRTLNYRYPLRRVRQEETPPGFRDRMVHDALVTGCSEILWLNPTVLFDPRDVERLRAHNLPFVCGIYPLSDERGLACEFTPGTTTIPFGQRGGQLPIVACELGFALIRRPVFEAIARPNPAGSGSAYFAIEGAGMGTAAEDIIFCRRVRAKRFEIIADTSIRLWRVGVARLGWEDVGKERERHDAYTLALHPAPSGQSSPTSYPVLEKYPAPSPNPLRGRVVSLPSHFPQIRLYILTYPANAESLEQTLASIRECDWGEEPIVITQPEEWPKGRESGSWNYQRALEAAVADGCDFAVILEDDVRVNKYLRHNLLTNPLIRRDQCDYLSLFMPDLIADPWERSEAHLGYRLAKPRYAGPNTLWQRGRVWGSQGYLLSRRFMLTARARWDRLTEGQDTRVLSVCSEFHLPLWYTMPCLVEHMPRLSAFGTPTAYAPDFDLDFRLEVGQGFQPPEDVPGWRTLSEAELLWRTAAELRVLELGTALGRSTVCLAQKAQHVVTVDIADQSEALEWLRRYELVERVEFHQGDSHDVCQRLTGLFGLIVIDTLPAAACLQRDITSALPLLEPGGLLAFPNYPDPRWPDVRRVVDEHACRLGWKRVSQADFLGIFRT